MYRYDPDLEFLGKVKSEDLNDLVQMLLYDKDGDARLTEELSMRDSYKRYHPDHHQYWEDIAGEIQCYGANTIAMWFRGGKGVLLEPGEMGHYGPGEKGQFQVGIKGPK